MKIPLKRRNLLLVLAGLLAGLLVVTIAVRYQSPGSIAETVESLPAQVDLALQDIDYAHSEAGVIRWRLQAERAERTAAGGDIAVRNLALTFFDEKGSRQVRVEADSGQADKDFQVITATGGVQIETERGYSLTTEELTFRRAEQVIRSGRPVIIDFGGARVRGHALALDLESQAMTVYNGVRATLPTTGWKQ